MWANLKVPDWGQIEAVARTWGIPGGIGTVVGAFLAHTVKAYQARIQEVEYTVTHDRLGIAVNDAVHGEIEIRWRGNAVNNLFSSTVTVINSSSKDYKDLPVAIWSNDPTILLTERLETVGSVFPPRDAPDYHPRFDFEAGLSPEQVTLLQHRREHLVPFLNLGMRAVFRYLTTVPTNVAPILNVEVPRDGVRAKFRRLVPYEFGAPRLQSVYCGLAIAPLIVWALHSSNGDWWRLSLGLAFGLMVIPIGATVYRSLDAISRIVRAG